MKNLISIEEALALKNPQFIDLRSPKEYQEAHIPGALNLPLLEDEERALIGLIYKEQSPGEAIDKGFTYIAPKLPAMYASIKKISNDRDVVLYCWRGGMRSQSISQVLDILGTKHYRLEGGYKAYRRHVVDFFSREIKQEIIVLDGLTGVGKTEILQELKKGGLPAIDLEDLANNRGSVFGNVGLLPQPMQKHFEGLLCWECLMYKDYPRLVVECESHRIGKNIIPDSFFAAMQKGYRILIYDDFEKRVNRLVATYVDHCTKNNDEQLISAINNLRKRLGNKKAETLIGLVGQKDYKTIAAILLADYYDPLYRYPAGPSDKYAVNLPGSDLDYTIEKIKELLK